MEQEIEDMVRRLVRLEDELERKLEAQREQFQYCLEDGTTFFEALGFRRFQADHPEFQGDRPRRVAWFVRYPGSGFFGIEAMGFAGKLALTGKL